MQTNTHRPHRSAKEIPADSHGPEMRHVENLHTIFDRVSHSMRTHLGVALGILEDLDRDVELAPEDFADARSSLHAMLEVLNSMRDLTNPPQFNPTEIDLFAALTEELETNFTLPPTPRIRGYLQPIAERHVLDKTLFSRAVRTLLSYSYSRLARFPNGEKTPLTLDLAKDRGQTTITIVAHQRTALDHKLLRHATTLKQVAEIDHTTTALGLLFADEVFLLHGHRSTFSHTAPEQFSFQITIPLP